MSEVDLPVELARAWSRVCAADDVSGECSRASFEWVAGPVPVVVVRWCRDLHDATAVGHVVAGQARVDVQLSAVVLAGHVAAGRVDVVAAELLRECRELSRREIAVWN